MIGYLMPSFAETLVLAHAGAVFWLLISESSRLHFQMTSSSTGEPSGRLATPITRRDEIVSSPKTSRSNSDAASATFACSVNSGVAATYTPSLTTRLTRFSEPNCFFVQRKRIERGRVRRFSARLHVQVFADDANDRRRVARGGEHPAQEKEVARLNGRHVGTKRRWRIRQMNAEPGKTVLGGR